MVDIDFSIKNVYYDCSMIGLTSLRVMLDYNIPDLGICSLLEIPSLRILYEILTVGTRMVLIVESSDCIDARLELISGKCHISTSR